MIRVLWVTKGLGPGGAEKLLVSAVRAHDNASFHIECAYVLPFKDHLTSELEAAGVRCHCLSNSTHDWWWPRRLAALVRSGDFDIVHCHSPLPASVARLSAITPGGSRPRVMSTVHNTWGSFNSPTRLANGLTSTVDDISFAVSSEVLASMRGPVTQRAEVLTHGIDGHAVAARLADRTTIRESFGFSDSHVVVGTVANFRPQKDYPTFLAAVDRARSAHPNLRFVAVGQGPSLETTASEAARMGLGDCLMFTGYEPDATRVMATFDIFTMASAWEGLPVAIMEACALGLPIVATNVGGIAETLTDEDNGLLVPPNNPDALAEGWLRVANEASLAATLRRGALRLAPTFSASRTQATIEAAYRGLVTPTPPSAESPQSGSKEPRSPTRLRKPPSGSGAEIRPAEPEDRPAILALLQRAMHRPEDLRFAELFEWKHDQSPFGSSPTWVATQGGSLLGVRVFMRWEFERDGHILRAVRAVDTATDPQAQGKGLFTALTRHAIREMEADGVNFVFNTPNDKSRPGYLKMGWREIGQLQATVKPTGPSALLKMARSRVPASLWSQPLNLGVPIAEWLAHRSPAVGGSHPVGRVLRTRRTADFLLWRYGSGPHHYRVVDNGCGDSLVVRVRRRGAATELVVADILERRSDGPVSLPSEMIRATGCDYALHLEPRWLRDLQVPLPGGGPILTWRHLTMNGCPPLPNWDLHLGDVELF